MLGWSISARACRSASNRAMTWRLSMPALMSLSATLRCTGWVCSAMKTVPMPPSPICWSSLYGPMTVPGRLAEGMSADLFARRGREGPSGPQGRGRPIEETAGFAMNLEKLPHLLLKLGVSAAGFADVAVPLLRRQLADGVKE